MAVAKHFSGIAVSEALIHVRKVRKFRKPAANYCQLPYKRGPAAGVICVVRMYRRLSERRDFVGSAANDLFNLRAFLIGIVDLY